MLGDCLTLVLFIIHGICSVVSSLLTCTLLGIDLSLCIKEVDFEVDPCLLIVGAMVHNLQSSK
jgi:hypothetical protein